MDWRKRKSFLKMKRKRETSVCRRPRKRRKVVDVNKKVVYDDNNIYNFDFDSTQIMYSKPKKKVEVLKKRRKTSKLRKKAPKNRHALFRQHSEKVKRERRKKLLREDKRSKELKYVDIKLKTIMQKMKKHQEVVDRNINKSLLKEKLENQESESSEEKEHDEDYDDGDSSNKIKKKKKRRKKKRKRKKKKSRFLWVRLTKKQCEEIMLHMKKTVEVLNESRKFIIERDKRIKILLEQNDSHKGKLFSVANFFFNRYYHGKLFSLDIDERGCNLLSSEC